MVSFGKTKSLLESVGNSGYNRVHGDSKCPVKL